MVNIRLDTSQVSIGQMRSTIVFKNNTGKTADLTGGFIDDYETFLTTKGFLQRKQGLKSGARVNEFGEELFEEFYTMVCRYQTALEDNLKIDTIIESNGKTFKIVSYQLVDEKNFYYYFALTGRESVAGFSDGFSDGFN